MKDLTMKLTIAAATFMAVAGAASAQTESRANDKVSMAGTYQVQIGHETPGKPLIAVQGTPVGPPMLKVGIPDGDSTWACIPLFGILCVPVRAR
jgi:hypothetical protein